MFGALIRARPVAFVVNRGGGEGRDGGRKKNRPNHEETACFKNTKKTRGRKPNIKTSNRLRVWHFTEQSHGVIPLPGWI